MSYGLSPPRYWDGRVRRVVATRYTARTSSALTVERVETLECGHEKRPWFKKSGGGNRYEGQLRVCFVCRPMPGAVP